MIPPLVLQQSVCDPNKTFADYITSFEFIKAPTCTYANETGWLVMGLMVYGAISLSIYIRTDSLVIPVVLLLLVGGAVLTQVAAIASPIAVLVLIAVPSALVALAYYYYG